MATIDKETSTTTASLRAIDRRILIGGTAALALLAASTVGLGVYASGETTRAAETACRASIISVGSTLSLGEEVRVRDLRNVDTTSDPQAARLVAEYTQGLGPSQPGQSVYIVTGNVGASTLDGQSLSCLVVFERSAIGTATIISITLAQ